MKKSLGKLLALVLTLAMCLSLIPSVALAADAEPTKVVILSTTDLHGAVWGENLLTGDKLSSSLLSLAIKIKEERANCPNTILIDNGDTFQGTPIVTDNIIAGVPSPNPMAAALRYLQYDAMVLGNHEFNYPWEAMNKIYDYMESTEVTTGSPVPVLAANLYESDGETNALTPYIVKEFNVDGHPYRVGVIGFENTDCSKFDAGNFGTTTLEPKGNPTRDMVLEANKYVSKLRASKEDGGEDCDFVVVSYHSGTERGDNADPSKPLTLYSNTENQITRMVAGNDGIDLVIAGHDHGAYSAKTTRPDKTGKEIPIINGGGSQLAKVELSITYAQDAGFTTTVNRFSNIRTNKDSPVDAGLKALIKPAADAAEDKVNQKIGKAIGDWDKSGNFKIGQNDSIDLINRAQIWKTQQIAAETKQDIALDVSATTSIPNGSSPQIAVGDLSIKDIYKIYKYDNYVYVMPMTGAQLKAWLEGVGAFYSADTSEDPMVYKVAGNYVTALFYGLDFTFDLKAPAGSRVKNLCLSATGIPVADDDVLNVGVNNYLIGQDPFVSAMGKDASSEEEKQALLDMAIWSSQEALGDEAGLVTQMAADFVTAETARAGGVSPLRSGWALGYEVPELFQSIGIYSTTDMHGRVYDANPVGGTFSGNFLQVATAMKEERAKMDGSILVDVGDILQGSTIMSYNINVEGGANNPTALALRAIGYDAFVPGNHEFNYNLDVQGAFYDLLTAPAGGAVAGTPVTPLCANLLDAETEEIAGPYTPYIVKEYTVGSKTFKVGVLGLENVNVPNWDLPSHYEGMIFAHKDNVDQSYTYEWVNYWQEEMRTTAGCDIVVVAAHSGNGGSTYSKENQLRHFIENTTGIDLVLGGHNHSVAVETYNNKDGKPVSYANAGGSTLIKAPIYLFSDGSYRMGEVKAMVLTPSKTVPGYTADAELKTQMTPFYEKALTFVTTPIGTLSGTWDTVNDYHYVQSDSYDFVHKAQLWAANADVSITTPVPKSKVNGTVGKFKLANLFAEGAKTASVTLKDCYNLYQYDNNLLYGITMTGKQLKDWLEHCTKSYSVKDGVISGGGFGADIAYGVNYQIYLGNPEGSRVMNMTLADGTPVTDTTELKVALSSYRLAATEGNDAYGWFATTGITSTSKNVYFDASVSPAFGDVGGSVSLILGKYLEAMCKDGATVTPGSATHWTMQAGAYSAPSSGGSSTPSSKVDVKDNQVLVTLAATSKPLTTSQQKSLVTQNETKPIILTSKELKVTIPKGTLSSGADINAMLVGAKAKGNIIRVTAADGTVKILPFAVVGDGVARYRAALPGTYSIADNTKTFPDVPASHWAADAISFVSAHEFFRGGDNGNFVTDDNMTLAMLLTVLARMDGGKATTASSFLDVPANAWYADAVNWAVEFKLVEGSDRKLNPDQNITREQLCVILDRFATHMGIQLEKVASADGFSDADSISSWATSAVKKALETGLLTGKPGNLVDPQGAITRSEIAAVLMRFVTAVVK